MTTKWLLPRFALLLAGITTAVLINHPMYTLAVLGSAVIMFVDGSLAAAAAIPFLFIAGVSGLIVGNALLPTTYDQQLWRFDGLLGFQPSDLVAKLFHAVPVVGWVSMSVYNGIFVVLTLIALDRKRSHTLILKILIAAVAAGLLCAIVPACGPGYLARGDLAQRPRDCIPSGHLAWALLLFWHSRREWGKAAQALCGLYVALTFLATLGSGEHYLIDLAVAVPFALAVDRLIPFHLSGVLYCTSVTLFWLLFLRYGLAHLSPADWLLVSATIGSAVLVDMSIEPGKKTERFIREAA